MEGIQVVMPREDMVVSEADQAELKASRARKRVFDLLCKAGQGAADGCVPVGMQDSSHSQNGPILLLLLNVHHKGKVIE